MARLHDATPGQSRVEANNTGQFLLVLYHVKQLYTSAVFSWQITQSSLCCVCVLYQVRELSTTYIKAVFVLFSCLFFFTLPPVFILLLVFSFFFFLLSPPFWFYCSLFRFPLPGPVVLAGITVSPFGSVKKGLLRSKSGSALFVCVCVILVVVFTVRNDDSTLAVCCLLGGKAHASQSQIQYLEVREHEALLVFVFR